VQVADDDCTSICCTLLPLRQGEWTYLQQSADSREKLVGYYVGSLRHLMWDYETHPPFAVFCSGVLASAWSTTRRDLMAVKAVTGFNNRGSVLPCSAPRIKSPRR